MPCRFATGERFRRAKCFVTKGNIVILIAALAMETNPYEFSSTRN
jgi:hypothetical protein